jgi:flavin-dependent dehydrogenase
MKPIVIIGGGLAGLTLGTALRQRDIPVSIFEAGHYPRHRVCGEFISGRGRDVLARLGLEDKLFAAGARQATTAAFFTLRTGGRVTPLPEPALCVSRHTLDALLAAEFRRLGGILHENHRWTGPYLEGALRATGRRTETAVQGWRWFGLKAHVRQLPLTADLEMHLLPHGYVGLCQLSDGTANVCGLFRTKTPVSDLAQTWRTWLSGPKNSSLHQRLAPARFLDDTFCGVGGLSLRPQTAASHPDCALGDAITMIAPLTGNGMSMAFESAELALETMISYSLGQQDWPVTRARIAQACDQAFARRLRWSHRLQEAFFQPALGAALLWLGSRAPALWRRLFALTRR